VAGLKNIGRKKAGLADAACCPRSKFSAWSAFVSALVCEQADWLCTMWFSWLSEMDALA